MKDMNDKKLLLTMRSTTLVFTVLVTIYAIYAVNSGATIFKMVENAYQITLVSAFIPLAFGVYWRRATNQGAMVSIACGVSVWILGLLLLPEDYYMPPHFIGLIASLIGMLVGSLMPQFIRHDYQVHDLLRKGHLSNANEAAE